MAAALQGSSGRLDERRLHRSPTHSHYWTLLRLAIAMPLAASLLAMPSLTRNTVEGNADELSRRELADDSLPKSDLSPLAMPGKHRLRVDIEGVKSNEVEIEVIAAAKNVTTQDAGQAKKKRKTEKKAAEKKASENKQAAAVPLKDRLIDCAVSGPKGPLVGAKVTVTLSLARSKEDKDRGPGEVIEERVYTTDVNGKYQIRISEDFSATSELQIAVKVAYPDHLERTMGPLLVSDFQGKQRGGIIQQMAWRAIQSTRLRKARYIRGRILLPNGQPAIGATVTAQTKYRAYSWKFFSTHDYNFRDSAVTDRRGQFSIRADQRISMTVFKPGEAPLIIDDFDKRVAVANKRVAVVGGNAANTLWLPKAIVVRGRVLDDKGNAVPRALVAAQRDFQWNESNMPLSFGRTCVADEKGRYILPPLPAGKYKLTIRSRLAAGSDLAGYNLNAARSIASHLPSVALRGSAKFKSEPLELVFLPLIETIGAKESTTLDLKAVPMVPIKAKVLFPDGPPDPKRHSDVGIAGKINGRRWQGRYVKAGKDGIATLLGPKGLGPFMIKTGTAFHRRGAEADLEIGQAIHFRDLNEDFREITVIKRNLATLEVKLSLPAELQREYSRSKAHISIRASYLRKGYREQSPTRQTLSLTGSVQRGASEYRGKALPGEPILLAVVLRKAGATTLLHQRRITLKPDEVSVQKIDLGKPR